MKQRTDPLSTGSPWARLVRRPVVEAADPRIAAELSTIVERRISDPPPPGPVPVARVLPDGRVDPAASAVPA